MIFKATTGHTYPIAHVTLYDPLLSASQSPNSITPPHLLCVRNGKKFGVHASSDKPLHWLSRCRLEYFEQKSDKQGCLWLEELL